MSGKTKIEWATDQWNPVTGCTKVSQGCKHCYAEREWPRLAAPRPKPNIYTGRAFTDVKCHPEKLDIPLHWRKPRRIFVNSMSDLFHEGVPDGFIVKVFETMLCAPQHIFQVLTKRPGRARSWFIEYGHLFGPDSDPLQNVWLGVSVEDQATADERIPMLLQIPAAVRWVSAEPLLGQIDIQCWLKMNNVINSHSDLNRVDWVVAGGESGPQARPMHPYWVRSMRDQCHAAGVPFFFKQWGEWITGERRGATFLWPDGVRQTVRLGLNGFDQGFWDDPPTLPCIRVGKKAAGRMLDGRTWDEYPK